MEQLRKRVMTWFAILLTLYVVYCGLLFFFQTKVIFPADMAGRPSGQMPDERIELDTDEGRTVAWYDPAPGADADNPAPLIVFFHGNAELVDQQSRTIDFYHGLGVSVFMVEYRGYGDSDGTPSETHIVADTVALIKPLLERDEVLEDRVVYHGRSIGGGLAAQVALEVEPQALIVESTFKSLSGMAWRFGVPPLLVRSPLRSDKAFAVLDLPILIMHGEHDRIVPVQHGRALAEIAKQSTLILFDADHNTLPIPQEVALYESSIRKHLEDAGVLD